MPVTINGIGTHYYGRGNASARRGTCEFCGRTATLTSFDTRECFCVVFIPLIPIAKYRIFDECSSCRKHRRVKFSDFERQVEGQVRPLREAVRRSPNDAGAHEALVRELASLRMNADAEEAARSAVDAIPNNAMLNLLAGQILASKGDLPGAAAFLERAVYFDTTDAPARLSFGRVLYLKGDYMAAAKQLEEAHRLAPSDATATYLLADSYMNLERWPDALAMWQQIPRPDRSVLKQIAHCKKRLGYELHPAEKKAARSWWPFSRNKRPRAIKPVRPVTSSLVSARRVLVGLALVIAVFTVGFIALGFWGSKHVDVYFDSTLPHPTFVIDGARFQSDIALPWRKSIAPGKHSITVLDQHGKEIEKRTIDIEAPEFGDAVFSNHKYVYNTGAQRVYRRESIDYTVNVADAKYSYEFVGNQAFFPIRGIDYTFVTPPATIDLPQGSTKQTKTSIQVERDFSLRDYGVYRLQQDKANEAESAFRTAITFNPCDLDSRGLLASVVINKGAADEGVSIGKEGVQACPGSMIEAHRVYQDALRGAGRGEEALAFYRGQLAQHNDSAAYHYLLGRIVPSSKEEIAEEREALRLDPTLARAHAALGYSLIASGEYDEAMREIASAIDNGLRDDSAPLYYVYAAIGAAKPAEARPVVDAAMKQRPYWTPRWLLALAEKKWTAARSLYDERTKNAPKSQLSWWLGAQLFRLQGDSDAMQKHLAEGTSSKELAQVAVAAHVEMLLEDGRWNDAIAAIDKAGDALGNSRDTYRMYAAAAAMLAGNVKEGERRVAELRAEVVEDEELDESQKAAMLAELGALDGSANAQGEIDTLREDLLQMKHAWFFLGARARATGDATRAREYFERSARASFDLNFPMIAAQRLSGS